jgi:L-alanine-DL-glutamate epimerase-like enolase superfamily enzyme
MAVFDAFRAASGVSLWSLFGGCAVEATTDVTLPMVPDARDRAAEYAAAGFRCFKVKIGRADTAEDLSVLADVGRALPDATFRLDANQAFTPDSATRFVDEALRLGVRIEYIEQPVDRSDLLGLDRVAARSPVPVYADEAVVSPADALRVVEQTCVHGLNVKMMKAGVRGALDIVAIARAAGRELMLGCMLESRRSIGFALALGTGCGAFSHYDLDSHMLLREEDQYSFFEQDGPVLRVTQR